MLFSTLNKIVGFICSMLLSIQITLDTNVMPQDHSCLGMDI